MNKELVLEAHGRGYFVTEDGEAYSGRGTRLILNTKIAYPTIGFWSLTERKNKSVYAHHLAAFCFYGEPAFSAACVRHLDGNVLNISKSNIALGSYSDNENDKCPKVKSRSARIAARSTKRFLQKPTPKQEAQKVCHRCLTEKPLNSFGRYSRSADGLCYWCLNCRAAYESQRRTRLGL